MQSFRFSQLLTNSWRGNKRHLSELQYKKIYLLIFVPKEDLDQPVQSEQSSLSTWRNFAYLDIKMSPVKILIRLYRCAGWSESLLDTHLNVHFLTMQLIFSELRRHLFITSYEHGQEMKTLRLFHLRQNELQ